MGNEGRGYAKTIGRTERMMIRWMCGVKLSDRKANAELLSRLGIVCLSDVRLGYILRWFGQHKEPDDWVSVSACRNIVVESVKGRDRGRPRKMARVC